MVRSLLTLAALCAASASAQTFNAFFPHLGNSQAIKGDQQSLGGGMTLTVLTNETHALVSMNLTGTSMSKAGWLAIGSGSTMVNSDMTIAWPNSDGSWTLSHRTAGGHQMPQAVSPQPTSSDVSIISALTTNSTTAPFASIAFLRPLSFSSAYSAKSSVANLQRASGQNMIYAASSRNPGSNAVSASITQHDQDSYGSIQVDLSKAVSAATVAVAAPAATVSAPWTRRDSIIVLHALCGGLAWLIIAPGAVLLARLGRHFQGWFRLHQLMQSVLVGALTLAAVILGAVSVNIAGTPHANTTHKRLGYALLAVLLFQLTLGWWIHRLFDAKRTKRPVRNIAHMVTGITLMVLGYLQAYKGFQQYSRPTPGYVLAVFWVSAAGFAVVYVFSCLRLAQVRHEQGMSWSHAAASLGRDQPGQMSKRNSPFGGAEKNIGGLDYLAQPPARYGQDVKLQPVESLATHDRSFTATPPLRLNNPGNGSPPRRPISPPRLLHDPPASTFDPFRNQGQSQNQPWTTFANQTDTDLPYADHQAPSQRLPTAGRGNGYPHFGMAK